MKQLQEVVGNTLEHKGIGNDFLNRTQTVQYLRERMNKWDCIPTKELLHSKRNSQKAAHRKSFPFTHFIRD
jgi:hypothetical protein